MDADSTTVETTHSIKRKLFRLAASTSGAAIGLGLVLWQIDPPSAPFFLASFGGSTIFLFGISRTPAAQPRAYFGGHLIGIACGSLCLFLFGTALRVYVVAFLLAFILMLVTRTVHPPAGANPLIILHANAPFAVIWPPVLFELLILFAVAMIWSRLVPKMLPYPSHWNEKSPPTIAWSGWLE